jgi:hypothetical protein
LLPESSSAIWRANFAKELILGKPAAALAAGRRRPRVQNG